MKDKVTVGEMKGYEKIPASEVKTTRERKMRQQRWANLEDNPGLQFFEGMDASDEDFYGGFLPRNNYEDRY